MKRKYPTKLGAKGLQIVRLIDTKELGMTSAEIGKVFGLAPNTIAQHMTAAKKLGFVMSKRIGTVGPVWFTPDHQKAIEAQLAKIKAEATAKKNAYHRVYRKTKRAKHHDVFEGRDTLPIRRSIIQAKEAAPMRPTGPSSVFHLGAA